MVELTRVPARTDRTRPIYKNYYLFATTTGVKI